MNLSKNFAEFRQELLEDSRAFRVPTNYLTFGSTDWSHYLYMKNKTILSRINDRSCAYTEWRLFTTYENSPSKWALKLSLKRQLCFSHGPVEGSDLGFRINGRIGIRPHWAPVTSWHTMKQHKDGIQFNHDRGVIHRTVSGNTNPIK